MLLLLTQQPIEVPVRILQCVCVLRCVSALCVCVVFCVCVCMLNVLSVRAHTHTLGSYWEITSLHINTRTELHNETVCYSTFIHKQGSINL